MYAAKDAGRNTYRYYTNALTKRAFERVIMDTKLHDALKEHEFMLYYQPQYDARNNRLIGVEALIQWNHNTMGIVSPAQFIPVLESSSLIIPVGEWISPQNS